MGGRWGSQDGRRELKFTGGLTCADGAQGGDGLPENGEQDPDAEDVHGAPGHPHHEPHHEEALERGLRHLPGSLLTAQGAPHESTGHTTP